MPGPLIDERGRRPAVVAVAICIVVVVSLAAVVWHGTSTSFDTWVFGQAFRRFGGPNSERRRFWLLFTEPAVSFALPAALVLWGLITRQWRVVVLTVTAPVLALGVTELIGKPLVDRILGPGVLSGSFAGAVHGSYPSGHETAAVSWVALLVLFVLRGARSVLVRATAIVLGALWALAGALGLTINYYHYATDTIAAIGVSLAVVLILAFAIDGCATVIGRRFS